MKKKYRFMSSLLALSLLLGGCGGGSAASSNSSEDIGESTAETNVSESTGESVAEKEETRYYAGKAAIFGTTAYVPVAEKQLLTVRNVSEVKAASDGKNMLLVTPSGEVYAADADRQKEVYLGSGSFKTRSTEGDEFVLMQMDNTGCTYYFQEAIWRYSFGSDGATQLAKGRPVTTVRQYESIIQLIHPDQTKTVCYYLTEDGVLQWICDSPVQYAYDTPNFLTINVWKISGKEQPYFFCSTYAREYIVGIMDGEPYEVCQLTDQESTWSYMGLKEEGLAVFFQGPYRVGPGTDVITVDLRTGEMQTLFHTESRLTHFWKTDGGFYCCDNDYKQDRTTLTLQHWDGTREELAGLPRGIYLRDKLKEGIYRAVDPNKGNHILKLDGSTVVEDTVLPNVIGTNTIQMRLWETDNLIVTDGMFNFLVPLHEPHMHNMGETVSMKLERQTIRDELIFLDVYNGYTARGGDGRGLYMLNVEDIKTLTADADPDAIVSKGTLICDNYVPGSLQTNQNPGSENALWLQRYDANGMKELCFWDGSQMTVMASEAN